MVTGFIYKIKIKGKTVDVYSCDPEYAEKMSEQGHIVNSCRYKTI